MTLAENYPMVETVIFRGTVNACLHFKIPFATDGSNLTAQGQYVLVRLAGESLASDVEGFALGTAPAQLAAEEALLKVELALIADKFSPVEAKCFSFYRNRQRQPVRTVGEFRKENGDIIVNAIK
jgi:hypothetical protein